MSSPFPEYFALFGLTPQFAVDQQALTRAYRQVQVRVHPDRHAAAGAAERRAAMQLASHANEAYDVLRSDVRRAEHLCRLHGVAVDGAGAAALPPAFLQRQMDWHERLEQAQGGADRAAVLALARDVAEHRGRVLAQIAEDLDRRHDAGAAAQQVRALMFLDKLSGDIERVGAGVADEAATGTGPQGAEPAQAGPPNTGQ